jgi:hypothetical protein
LLKLHGSAFAAMDALSCIFKRGGDSQAGRRGFDPRLPLHFLSITYILASVDTTDFDLGMGRLKEWKGGWALQFLDPWQFS